MDQRLRFIDSLSTCRYTMSELCRAYGISRKTGYKWARRYGEEGLEGLGDRSRRPHRCPHQTEERCAAALLAERRAHPLWGARKLLVRLRRRHPDWPWPAPSTAAALLKRHGLVKPRRPRRRRPAARRPDLVAEAPHALWTADFKGQFHTGDRQLCYPLTVVDRYSGFLLACRSRRSTARAGVAAVFEALFRRHGLPRAILTDQGVPFAAPQAPLRLSRLAIGWVRLGIEPRLIQPGRPQQNGSHERMHRTLKRATLCPPKATWAEQQAAFDRFRHEYNHERPHEGRAMRMPAELFAPSPRPYPETVEETTYPGHFERRRVRRNGVIKLHGRHLFVSETLRGQLLGLEESDDGLWKLYFGTLLLGSYHEQDRRFDAL